MTAPEVSPETDLDLLRAELDAARAEIERLREKDAEWSEAYDRLYRLYRLVIEADRP